MSIYILGCDNRDTRFWLSLNVAGIWRVKAREAAQPSTGPFPRQRLIWLQASIVQRMKTLNLIVNIIMAHLLVFTSWSQMGYWTIPAFETGRWGMGKKVTAVAVSFPFIRKRNAFLEPWEDGHFHMTDQNCDPVRIWDKQCLAWGWVHCCPQPAQGLLARKERMGWPQPVCATLGQCSSQT